MLLSDNLTTSTSEPSDTILNMLQILEGNSFTERWARNDKYCNTKVTQNITLLYFVQDDC
jgi:hypothetical protein